MKPFNIKRKDKRYIKNKGSQRETKKKKEIKEARKEEGSRV